MRREYLTLFDLQNSNRIKLISFFTFNLCVTIGAAPSAKFSIGRSMVISRVEKSSAQDFSILRNRAKDL